MKVTVSKKNKPINKKFDQNKAQYYLDRELLRFRLYSQEMLINMSFNWKKCFIGKQLGRKEAATIKRFEYSPLGNELKKQNGIAKY